MTAAPKHLRPHSSCTSSRIDVINCDRFLRSAKFNEYRSSHKMWLSANTDLRPIDRSIPNNPCPLRIYIFIIILFFSWASCFMHQAFMFRIVWYSENMEEKTAQLFINSNRAQICNLVRMLIFIWWYSNACNVNQCNVYKYEYQSSL